MSARRGVLSAGTWCVDFNKSVARWPEEDSASEILAIDRHGGGAGFNMALDLKRLDPAFPVEAMGVVGDDELGSFLVSQCDAHGVERSRLKALAHGATMSVDAFNVLENGRRTHFYYPGVAAEMTPDDFDFSTTRALFLHLGLPGAHRAMDRPWRGEANGCAATLKKAKGAGLMTNLELMTMPSAERLAELGRPCLAHLDLLIVNDYEIGALAGISTRRADGTTDLAEVERALESALAAGAMRWAVAHFPEGAAARGRDGTRCRLGSVAIPANAVKGANGAGDAFAAGMLYALHEGWPIQEGMKVAHAAAAASMRAVSTTEGVAPVAECLKLADQWGLRPLEG
ncbi:MAG: carbohydrate kinase family protein [Hyphomicrobiales bacterium]|nr:carbohydrate kinase family protein [Hyphomicrobiales bacterium]